MGWLDEQAHKTLKVSKTFRVSPVVEQHPARADNHRKIDIVLLPRDAFTRAAFQRRRRMEYEAGHSAAFITPEDIVVAKLNAYQKTES
jgi:hypothetical protein